MQKAYKFKHAGGMYRNKTPPFQSEIHSLGKKKELLCIFYGFKNHSRTIAATEKKKPRIHIYILLIRRSRNVCYA